MASRAHLEFDLRIVKWPVLWRQTVMMAPTGSVSTQKVFFTLVNGNTMAFSDQSSGNPVDHMFQTSPVPGKWSHIALDVDFSKHTVGLIKDGAGMLPAGEVFPALEQFALDGGSVVLSVGVRYSFGASDETEMLLDNVVLATD